MSHPIALKINQHAQNILWRLAFTGRMAAFLPWLYWRNGRFTCDVGTISRKVFEKVCTPGKVIGKKTRRPVDLVGMHSHEELAMMEAMLEHPERRLAEIAREMLQVFGRHFHVSSICRYSQRNGVTRKTVSFYFDQFHVPHLDNLKRVFSFF